MALGAGTRLGGYEILGLIGAGGMGEVYRARDSRLGRDVAIKVLPADRVADEGRRRRFVQEAQAASSLNHPHIVTIYEIDTVGDHDFIVMEYMSGKSVDALIPRHGMRLSEALRISIPVADALAAAHARGIIHRDLKPANVMVGTDGAVKVLDFGLAKLVGAGEDSNGETATVTTPAVLSAPGTVAGTAAYMAPEQATGGEVDARSDIFSFGTMLYEMVTGVRAFPGTSTADTLSAVIRAQPKPPSTIVRDLPSDLEKVILRCLRKDPQRRFQHIGDVKVALQEIKEESESGPAAAAVVPRSHRTLRIAAIVGSLILVAGLAAWRLRSPQNTETAALRVVPLTNFRGMEYAPTFSPDGQQLAFVWEGEREDNQDIYVKLVGSTEVRRLTSDSAADIWPRWSPNGQEIAFVRVGTDRNTLHLVSALSGTDRKVSNFAVTDGGLDWSPDGQGIVAGHVPVASANRPDVPGLYLIPLDGGEPRLLIQSDAPAFIIAPAFAPEGRRLAYASCQTETCSVYVVELDTKYQPVAAPRQLTRQRGVFFSSIAWARDGRSVIFGDSDNSANAYLWRAVADGSRAPERIEVAGLGAAWPTTVLSRDRLAFARITLDADLYRFVPGRPPEVVAASSFLEAEAALSADGRRLAFTSTRSGDALQIWVSNADGSDPQQLTRGTRTRGSPSWSPDARQLAFDSFDDDGHYHVWIMDADGDNRRQLTTDAGDQNRPTWSRDGQWIYFSWGQGTQRDIWRMHPSGGPKERVTRGGSGDIGEESADGTHLLYQAKNGDGPLLSLPLKGGDPQPLIACVSSMMFVAVATGIYYVPCFRDASDAPLHLLDPDTGTDRLLGTLEKYLQGLPILTVSRDGRIILYGRVTGASDLMLIENFR